MEAALAVVVFLRAWAKELPFRERELKNVKSQAVRAVARLPAWRLRRDLDRTNGFRDLRRNLICWIVFAGEIQKRARPWRNQSPERFKTGVPCKTLRRRATSSRIRSATSLLFIFGRARSRPSREKSVTIFV